MARRAAEFALARGAKAVGVAWGVKVTLPLRARGEGRNDGPLLRQSTATWAPAACSAWRAAAKNMASSSGCAMTRSHFLPAVCWQNMGPAAPRSASQRRRPAAHVAARSRSMKVQPYILASFRQGNAAAGRHHGSPAGIRACRGCVLMLCGATGPPQAGTGREGDGSGTVRGRSPPLRFHSHRKPSVCAMSGEAPSRREVKAAVRFLDRHPCVCNLRIGLRLYPRCFAAVVRSVGGGSSAPPVLYGAVARR